MVASRRLLIAVFCLAFWCGCICRNSCLAPDQDCPTVASSYAFECRQVDREPIVPDVSALRTVAAPEAIRYCALTELDAQCLAAFHSVIANLLVQESGLTGVSLRGKRQDGVLPDVLKLGAIHQRNEDSAIALELFFRLVVAEAGNDRINRSVQEIERMLDDIAQLEVQGLVSPVSKLEVEQQRLDARHRQLALQATIDQLNYQLTQRLKTELPSGFHFWPETRLIVDADIPSGEDAVLVALSNRADLAALRLAASGNPSSREQATQWLLRQISSGLGASSATTCLRLLWNKKSHDCNGEIRDQQLLYALSEREMSIRQETLQALAMLENRLAQMDLTRQKLDFARARLMSLEQQQQLTAGAPFNVRRTRLDLLVVEQELLQDVIEWKLAGVQLRRVQGLLASDCGYDLATQCGAGVLK